MSQIKKSLEQLGKKDLDTKEDLRKQFAEVSQKKKEYRTVKLVYIDKNFSYCGCGPGSGGPPKVTFFRNVDEDSPLKDGDIVDELLEDDEWI